MADEVLRERLRALPVFAGELSAFDPDTAPEHPAMLFCTWLEDAIEAEVREPHAMTLCTVDADGRPNARVLILKAVDDGRWQFATTRESPKGRELAQTPWAAATFYWSPLGRQVRLRGRVLDAGSQAAARDFLARSASARAEALAGTQSAPLADRGDLAAAAEHAQAQLDADPSLVAPAWTVYDLVPDEIEFWAADPNRRHVRLRYRSLAGIWTREALWP